MATGGTMAAAAASSVFTANDLKGRYATALYELAEEERALNKVIEEAENLLKIIDESPDFQKVLDNRALDTAESRNLVVETLKQAGFGQIIQNFVGVVANNRRLPRLKEFLSAFFTLVNNRRGVMTATVISAHPLDDAQRSQLQAKLAEAGYTKVNIQERIDSSLLGGLVVRVGAQLYDASLKSRLNRLHNVMKGAA